MKVIIEFEELRYDEAHAEEGAGERGIRLDFGTTVAWDCPMLGYGGTDTDYSVIAKVLTEYALDSDRLYVTNGPDQLLWLEGDHYILATITVE